MFPQSFTKNTGLPFYNYDQRGLLRNLTAQNGNQVLVDGLGMFVFYAGDPVQSTRVNATTPFVDDDESCFLTQGGAWVLEYPHWDLINNWRLPDLEDLNSVVFSRLNGAPRVFVAAQLVNALTAIGSSTATNQTLNVYGANVGDLVLVCPNKRLDGTGRGYVYGFVDQPNLVTIVFGNTNDSSNLTPATGIIFTVLVIKQS